MIILRYCGVLGVKGRHLVDLGQRYALELNQLPDARGEAADSQKEDWTVIKVPALLLILLVILGALACSLNRSVAEADLDVAHLV